VVYYFQRFLDPVCLFRRTIKARMPSSKPSATDSAGKPGIPIGKGTICVEVDVVDPVVVIVDVVS